MAEIDLLRAAVTIGFGALAGGLTNAVAIWMLFHPYEPWGPRQFRLQGAIPKNKARLAKTIGRTVGQRLLTSDDLAHQLTAPGLRAAFDHAVAGFVTNLLDTERGSLREELPPALIGEVELAFESFAPDIANRMVDFAATDGFRESVASFQRKVTDDIGDRPLSDFLTVARRAAIRTRVEDWVGEAVTNPGLETAVGHWLDRQIARFGDDATPLLERLPASVVAAVEQEIAGYLPVALDRIAAALADPRARETIQNSLHTMFEKFVKSLVIHERIVARLMVTERTIAKMLDRVERDGVDQMSKLLEEPEMRDQVARSVNEAVVKFLRKPLSEHMDTLGAERVDGIKATVSEHIMAAIRDDGTRRYAIDKVDAALEGAEDRTWGDILRHIPAEDAAEWISAALSSGRVRTWVAEGATGVMNRLLERPIGRPSARLPEGSIDRITEGLSPALWAWIQGQIPPIVAKLDIQQMVEEKVLGFSLARIEEIVRNTTQRELNLIVRLGYVLGAMVGGLAYGVSLVLG